MNVFPSPSLGCHICKIQTLNEVSSEALLFHESLGLYQCQLKNVFPANNLNLFFLTIYLFLKILFILERKDGRKREKHQCVRDTLLCCLLHTPNWGPGLQPRQACALTRNRTGDLSVRRPARNALSHTSQGWICSWISFKSKNNVSVILILSVSVSLNF